MANWSTLKTAIADIIKTNGNQEITGQLLQNVLNSIVSSVGENATFAGIATPETSPGAPDGPIFYLATTTGVYVNFNGIEVSEGEAVILQWNNSNWAKKTSGFATQEKLSQMSSNLGASMVLNNGGDISLVEANPNGVKRYDFGLSKHKTYTISLHPDAGGVVVYFTLNYSDGTQYSQLIEDTSVHEITPSKDAESFSITYGSAMTATSCRIELSMPPQIINYAPDYSEFNKGLKRFDIIESITILSQKRVNLKDTRPAYTFGFVLDIEDTPFKIGDIIAVGVKNVVNNGPLGASLELNCYDENENRVSAFASVDIETSPLLQVSNTIPANTKYITAYIRSNAGMDVDLGEMVLVNDNKVYENSIYTRNALKDIVLTQINYAPYYSNFNKAIIANDMIVSVASNNKLFIKESIGGAKVFGFQMILDETPFKIGDTITFRVKDVVLNNGTGYIMVLFYDQNSEKISAKSLSIETSDELSLTAVIPDSTYYIAYRFQSAGVLNAEAGECFLTKNNIHANTLWIRNEIISKGSSQANNMAPIYVDGDNGSDDNAGNKSAPLKTMASAIKKAGVDATIILSGNVYDRLNVKTNNNQKSIRVIGERGKINRFLLGTKIDNATLIQSGVYQIEINSFPPPTTSYCIWQHNIKDLKTFITEGQKHPLQRGKTHRLDSTKLSRVNNLDEVKASSEPVFYYDNSAGVLYFRVVAESSLPEHPIYLPTPDAAIYGNDGTVKIELTNVESWYSNMDLSYCDGAILTECAAKFGVNGGFFWNDCNGIEFVRCEACGVSDFDNSYGDGFSVGTSISESTEAKCTTSVMYDCWSHDNHDDGYSDHLNNETTIDGGLFEYNDGGITTSYGSKDVVRNAYARNNTEAGITVYGGNSEGTESIVSNCICENNSPYNFSVINGNNNRKTKGTFINCISIGAASVGYYANDNGTLMTLINCCDANSLISKDGNITVINAEKIV